MASRTTSRSLLATAAAAVVFFPPSITMGAPEWVDRGLTMRQFGVAIDAGIGIAHNAAGDFSGGGVSLDGAFGILDNLEVGLRFGLRVGDVDAKSLQADQYGRLFDLQSYGAGNSLFATPELRITGRVLDLSVVELGVEGRIYFPFATGTFFSFMFGAPVRLHISRILRIDTGVYVPVVFVSTPGQTQNAVTLNIPAEFWFQATRDFFVGPIVELRLNGENNDEPALGVDHSAGLLFGVGLGYALSRYADLKATFLFPQVNGSPGPDIAAGLGLGLHFD
jgi:hypothetical protein